MPWRPVRHSQIREHKPGAKQACRLLELRRSSPRRGTVSKHDVDRQFRRVVRQDLQVGVRREALGLTGLRRQIQRYQPPRMSAYQRRGQLRHQQVR